MNNLQQDYYGVPEIRSAILRLDASIKVALPNVVIDQLNTSEGLPKLWIKKQEAAIKIEVTEPVRKFVFWSKPETTKT